LWKWYIKTGVGLLKLKIKEVYELTPFEFQLMIEGTVEEQHRQLNLCITNAWYTANMVWIRADGKLEDIDKYWYGVEKQVQSPDDMEAKFRAFAAGRGG
jgi:hypothetical protein